MAIRTPGLRAPCTVELLVDVDDGYKVLLRDFQTEGSVIGLLCYCPGGSLPKFLEEWCCCTGHGKAVKDERELCVAWSFWSWHDGRREKTQG